MGAGDELSVNIHDSGRRTRHGRERQHDRSDGLDDGQRGQRVRAPVVPTDGLDLHAVPYALHPMYSTSSEHTRVSWAAHSYNVAFSDEIGHFEYCDAVDPTTGRCLSEGVHDPKVDADDVDCFDASQSLLVPVSGCASFSVLDSDFDGESYQPVWPGSDPTPSRMRLSIRSRSSSRVRRSRRRGTELLESGLRGRPAAIEPSATTRRAPVARTHRLALPSTRSTRRAVANTSLVCGKRAGSTSPARRTRSGERRRRSTDRSSRSRTLRRRPRPCSRSRTSGTSCRRTRVCRTGSCGCPPDPSNRVGRRPLRGRRPHGTSGLGVCLVTDGLVRRQASSAR